IGTARPDRSPVISQGAGVPDLPAAWRWLVSGRRAPDVTARAVGGTDAAVLASVAPDASAPAGQAFELVRPRNAPRAVYRLRSDSDWLSAPDSVIVSGGVSRVDLRYDAKVLAAPGVWTGAVVGWTADTGAGSEIGRAHV